MHPAHSSINTLQRDNLARLPSNERALILGHRLQRMYRRGSTEVVALREATCTILPGARIALSGARAGKSTLPCSALTLRPLAQSHGQGSAHESLRPSQVAFVFRHRLLPAHGG